ncbi:MAG: recombinase family protein [Nocardioidaceae bacterium]
MRLIALVSPSSRSPLGRSPPRLCVSPARIYVDRGLTGTTRDRPGLREALAPCREGDTLVVTKLDRLAPGHCPTRGRSPTSSPPDRSASACLLVDAVVVEVRLQDGELLLFDNLALAHGAGEAERQASFTRESSGTEHSTLGNKKSSFGTTYLSPSPADAAPRTPIVLG